MTVVSADARARAACADWERILGADRVVSEPAALAADGRTTLRRAPAPIAALRPSERAQVAEIVRIAAAHRVPLYPIGRGRNWGWGDACPVTEETALLDLSGLDRIVELDEEIGAVVVEPGVSQGQLADRLESTAWVADCSSAGPDTSVLGSTLDRAIGQSAFAERPAYIAGVEVVLADGSLVRTGLDDYPGSRIGRALRWGVGPWIDGIFTQSSFGIVTELGLWLMPRPAVAEAWLSMVPDTELEPFVDRLRMLRIGGVISGAPHVFPVANLHGEASWFTASAVSGSAESVHLAEAEIQASLEGLATSIFVREDDVASGRSGELLSRLDLPDDDRFREFLVAGTAFARGYPIQLSPPFVRSYVGGDAQRDTARPTSPDPLDNDWGFYFLWPVARATGKDVRGLVDVVASTLARHGRPLAVTLSIPSGRACVAVTRVAFDRSDEQDAEVGEACYRELFDATAAAGYPHARSTIVSMGDLDAHGSAYWETVRRLKTALDPDGIISPGRYLPPRR